MSAVDLFIEKRALPLGGLMRGLGAAARGVARAPAAIGRGVWRGTEMTPGIADLPSIARNTPIAIGVGVRAVPDIVQGIGPAIRNHPRVTAGIAGAAGTLGAVTGGGRIADHLRNEALVDTRLTAHREALTNRAQFPELSLTPDGRQLLDEHQRYFDELSQYRARVPALLRPLVRHWSPPIRPPNAHYFGLRHNPAMAALMNRIPAASASQLADELRDLRYRTGYGSGDAPWRFRSGLQDPDDLRRQDEARPWYRPNP